MNTPLKITKVGNSAAIILPKELLARLRVALGDTIYLTEAPDGVRLTATNPDFETQMRAAEEIMRKDRDILRVLGAMTGDLRVEPVWLDGRVAMAVHDRQLAEHGGGAGVRDAALLDSALARPVNRWSCGDDDPAALAAAYAYGVARNHPFVDGNKRTAWVLARLFLALNNHRLDFTAEAIDAMLALAAGELGEEELADWFREHLVTGD